MSGGIAGYICIDGAPADQETLQAMAAAAPHRCSGGAHYWAQGNAALAQLQTDILGALSKGAMRQVSVQRGCALVLHGYLINQADLRARLAGAGTDVDAPLSDADLVHLAYRRWGPALAEQLDGDFALALWDAPARRLLLLCDALGTRPLYFARSGNRLAFATEVAQIQPLFDRTLDLDEVTIAAYLCLLPLPPQRSFFKQIRRLPPATRLCWTDGAVTEERYWQLDPTKRLRCKTDQDYAEVFLEVFQRAVDARLEPDAKHAVLLSGGLDSSAVTAAAAERLRGQGRDAALLALSWDFTQEPAIADADELHYARAVAEHWQLPLALVPAHLHWPLRDTGSLTGPGADSPYRAVYEELHLSSYGQAREAGVGVLFTGFPGDPQVGMNLHSYPDYLLRGRWVRLSSAVRAHARASGLAPWRILRSLCLGRLRDAALGRHVHLRTSEPPWMSESLLRAVGWRTLLHECLPALPPGAGSIARRERYECLASSNWADHAGVLSILSARAGLDVRNPWLDRALFELCLAVPQDQFMWNGLPKTLVRRAFKQRLPQTVLGRTQRAVPSPLFYWGLREHAAGQVEWFFGAAAAAPERYNQAAIEAERRRWRQGGRFQSRLWRALTLALWQARNGP